MKEAFIAVVKWFAGFFEEDKPQSFSRGLTFILVAFIMGWDCAQVHFTKHTIEPSTLIGQMTAASVFYFIRRTAGTVESTVNKKSDSPVNGQPEQK